MKRKAEIERAMAPAPIRRGAYSGSAPATVEDFLREKRRETRREEERRDRRG